MFKGKKTYLTAIAGVIVVAATYWQGVVDPSIDGPSLSESLKLGLGYLTAVFLRRGIKTDTGN